MADTPSRLRLAVILLLCAAVAAGASFLLYAVFAAGTGATPAQTAAKKGADAGVRVATSNFLSDPDGHALLATQSDEKRNQILVVDLYSQILGRYPDAAEQRAWFDDASAGSSKDRDALARMRDRAATDDEIASYIAGAIFDEPKVKARAPLVREPDADGNLITAATVVAHIVQLRPEFPKDDNSPLFRWLERVHPVKPAEQTRLPVVKALLTQITGSTDIGEHFVEDANDDTAELNAMRTLLKSGKLLVLSGNDVDGPSRALVVIGFDRSGSFIVRDVGGNVPEKVKGPFLMAFLRHPGLSSAPNAKASAGFWLDVPGQRTKVKCVAHPTEPVAAATPEPAEEPAPPVSWDVGTETGVIAGAQVNLAPLKIPPGEHTLRGTLSVTAEQIDAILTAARSPAAGSGHAFVKYGQYYNIDPIYALAFFRRESFFGAHPRWIGRKPGGDFTKNIGNIRYVGRPNPQRVPQYGEFNGFRDYDTWEDGIHDWFKLIAQDANYTNLHTVERIIPKYAPSFENDTSQYVVDVVKWVQEWRDALGEKPAGQVQFASEKKAAPTPPDQIEVDCR